MTETPVSHKRHRFRPGVIAHAVWLCVRCSLSLREVGELLVEHGIGGSYESIRRR